MPPPKIKGAHLLVWLIQYFMAYTMFQAAFAKFLAMDAVVVMFDEIGMEPHGRILIGLIELLAAVCLLIPGSSIYGAFLALGVMVGAIIGHLTNIGIEGVDRAVLVLVGCSTIIYLRREESSLFRNMFARQ